MKILHFFFEDHKSNHMNFAKRLKLTAAESTAVVEYKDDSDSDDYTVDDDDSTTVCFLDETMDDDDDDDFDNISAEIVPFDEPPAEIDEPFTGEVVFCFIEESHDI